ncbi:hypothetical protein EDC55_10726 [Allofrancisella inopinata]|uniref:Uncharacterized protein n=1 Tax=Allofrancisella inopinata TaxID=1085647 RepID=A0AAE6YIT7_9GAMM|nr:hypothetical protein [Allofrancisella inopinata]QIV95494.1 hypothetical protein E4K63_01025 [Allofrancisella inopinata]TDT72630.1 hypothetical protein EDC55_10726 [Allofrancisella inopinata]
MFATFYDLIKNIYLHRNIIIIGEIHNKSFLPEIVKNRNFRSYIKEKKPIFFLEEVGFDEVSKSGKEIINHLLTLGAEVEYLEDELSFGGKLEYVKEVYRGLESGTAMVEIADYILTRSDLSEIALKGLKSGRTSSDMSLNNSHLKTKLKSKLQNDAEFITNCFVEYSESPFRIKNFNTVAANKIVSNLTSKKQDAIILVGAMHVKDCYPTTCVDEVYNLGKIDGIETLIKNHFKNSRYEHYYNNSIRRNLISSYFFASEKPNTNNMTYSPQDHYYKSDPLDIIS